MNTTQGTLSISDYFYKIKNLCREIEQLDADAKFGEDRVRRIIINGLKPEYNSFIAAVQGWPTQPTLVEFENLLANQEALVNQMTKLTLRQSNEEALYTTRTSGRFRDKRASSHHEDRRERRELQGNNQSDDEEDELHEEGHHRPTRWTPRGKCYNCGREGHHAKQCKYKVKEHGNFAKDTHAGDESEEEWDFEKPYVMANYCEDCSEEEEWDTLNLSQDEMWIEDLEEAQDLDKDASLFDVEEEEHVESKEGYIELKMDQDGSKEKHTLHVAQEHMEKALKATQESLLEKLIDVGDVKGKKGHDKAAHESVLEMQVIETSVKKTLEKQGELSEVAQAKTNDHKGAKEKKTSLKAKNPWKTGVHCSKIKEKRPMTKCDKEQTHGAEECLKLQDDMKSRERVVKGDTHLRTQEDKFDIGANIKRPPRRGPRLGIEGEY